MFNRLIKILKFDSRIFDSSWNFQLENGAWKQVYNHASRKSYFQVRNNFSLQVEIRVTKLAEII